MKNINHGFNFLQTQAARWAVGCSLQPMNIQEAIMQKRFFVGALVFVALLGSCSLGSSPKAAVQKFGKAIEKNDMKALAQVATPETVQLIAAFGSKIQGYAASMSAKKIKTVTEKIDGNTAVVTVIFADGEEENFDLVKIDGKWKVAIDFDFK